MRLEVLLVKRRVRASNRTTACDVGLTRARTRAFQRAVICSAFVRERSETVSWPNCAVGWLRSLRASFVAHLIRRPVRRGTLQKARFGFKPRSLVLPRLPTRPSRRLKGNCRSAARVQLRAMTTIFGYALPAANRSSRTKLNRRVRRRRLRQTEACRKSSSLRRWQPSRRPSADVSGRKRLSRSPGERGCGRSRRRRARCRRRRVLDRSCRYGRRTRSAGTT